MITHTLYCDCSSKWQLTPWVDVAPWKDAHREHLMRTGKFHRALSVLLPAPDDDTPMPEHDYECLTNQS